MVDDVVLFVRAEARAQGIDVCVAGVTSYCINSLQYTVAFIVGMGEEAKMAAHRAGSLPCMEVPEMMRQKTGAGAQASGIAPVAPIIAPAAETGSFGMGFPGLSANSNPNPGLEYR